MIGLLLQSDQLVNALILVEVEIEMSDDVGKREEVERDVQGIMAIDATELQMKWRVMASSIGAIATISNDGATRKNLDMFLQCLC